MRFNLTEKMLEFLQNHPDQKFTAREIAGWVFESFPDYCQEKRKRSKATVIPIDSDSALIQQLVAEIGARNKQLQQRYPEIKMTEGRPRRYYLSTKSDETEVSDTEAETTPSSPHSEHDLYPLLSDYLWGEFSLYSKRIDEKRSRNVRGPGGNRWLYPDVIGFEDLSHDWSAEVKQCVQQIADRKSRFYSFEVKKLINPSNVREAYFQAVSNSSWANFGYLVAAEIQSSVMKELRMLASLHGIGLIKLDADNPAESEIMIPARERSEVDWNAANRLAEENADFMNCVKLVRQFYQTGDIRPQDWDVPED